MPDIIAVAIAAAIVAIAAAIVVLSGGTVKWVNTYLRKRPTVADASLEELGHRLDAIEGRLRDITDVMISVSEKIDHMEDVRP